MNFYRLHIVISIALLSMQAAAQSQDSRLIAEAAPYSPPAGERNETNEKSGDGVSEIKPLPRMRVQMMMLADIEPVQPMISHTYFKPELFDQGTRSMSSVGIGFQYMATPWRTNIPQVNFRIAMNGSEYARQFTHGAAKVIGVELALLGVMTTLPRSFTKWEDDYKQQALRNLGRAYHQPPVWDEDDWAINYIGHPYNGSLFYNVVRSQGASIFESFVFSAFLSTVWEYVIEAVAEQPSTQDLFITPIVGSALGELIHIMTLNMKKNGTNIFEKMAITILNPVHAIQEGYN